MTQTATLPEIGTRMYIVDGYMKGSIITIKDATDKVITISTKEGDIEIDTDAAMTAIGYGQWSVNPNGRPVNYPADAN
jgi:hypothetical protein